MKLKIAYTYCTKSTFLQFCESSLIASPTILIAIGKHEDSPPAIFITIFKSVALKYFINIQSKNFENFEPCTPCLHSEREG